MCNSSSWGSDACFCPRSSGCASGAQITSAHKIKVNIGGWEAQTNKYKVYVFPLGVDQAV